MRCDRLSIDRFVDWVTGGWIDWCGADGPIFLERFDEIDSEIDRFSVD